MLNSGPTETRTPQTQHPYSYFQNVATDNEPRRFTFELRSLTNPSATTSWPLLRVASLITSSRDAARTRLLSALPERTLEIERYLVGSKPSDSAKIPSQHRIRIVPLPSIGASYADRDVRRILVEVPGESNINGEEVSWAFSGAELLDPETGDANGIVLRRVIDNTTPGNYGVDNSAHTFRSVTPVVLPFDPKRQTVASSDNSSKHYHTSEIAHARGAVIQALRHAGVATPVASVQLQREPFTSTGLRVESFAQGTRFENERLWYVAITFRGPVIGPLLIGDGRFLGLGLMAPQFDTPLGIYSFSIVSGLECEPDPIELARALRRAVMARVNFMLWDQEQMDPFFSGHSDDGGPIRGTTSSHLSFAYDSLAKQLIIVSPHLTERRAASPVELNHLSTLDSALVGFKELRAGRAGVLRLSRNTEFDSETGAFLTRSRVWESCTPYVVTRHAKNNIASDALIADVLAECQRLSLPEAHVIVRDVQGIKGVGLSGSVRITFANSIEGPLLLGKTRYLGGGFFRSVENE